MYYIRRYAHNPFSSGGSSCLWLYEQHTENRQCDQEGGEAMLREAAVCACAPAAFVSQLCDNRGQAAGSRCTGGAKRGFCSTSRVRGSGRITICLQTRRSNSGSWTLSTRTTRDHHEDDGGGSLGGGAEWCPKSPRTAPYTPASELWYTCHRRV